MQTTGGETLRAGSDAAAYCCCLPPDCEGWYWTEEWYESFSDENVLVMRYWHAYPDQDGTLDYGWWEYLRDDDEWTQYEHFGDIPNAIGSANAKVQYGNLDWTFAKWDGSDVVKISKAEYDALGCAKKTAYCIEVACVQDDEDRNQWKIKRFVHSYTLTAPYEYGYAAYWDKQEFIDELLAFCAMPPFRYVRAWWHLVCFDKYGGWNLATWNGAAAPVLKVEGQDFSDMLLGSWSGLCKVLYYDGTDLRTVNYLASQNGLNYSAINGETYYLECSRFVQGSESLFFPDATHPLGGQDGWVSGTGTLLSDISSANYLEIDFDQLYCEFDNAASTDANTHDMGHVKCKKVYSYCLDFEIPEEYQWDCAWFGATYDDLRNTSLAEFTTWRFLRDFPLRPSSSLSFFSGCRPGVDWGPFTCDADLNALKFDKPTGAELCVPIDVIIGRRETTGTGGGNKGPWCKVTVQYELADDACGDCTFRLGASEDPDDYTWAVRSRTFEFVTEKGGDAGWSGESPSCQWIEYVKCPDQNTCEKFGPNAYFPPPVPGGPGEDGWNEAAHKKDDNGVPTGKDKPEKKTYHSYTFNQYWNTTYNETWILEETTHGELAYQGGGEFSSDLATEESKVRPPFPPENNTYLIYICLQYDCDNPGCPKPFMEYQMLWDKNAERVYYPWLSCGTLHPHGGYNFVAQDSGGNTMEKQAYCFDCQGFSDVWVETTPPPEDSLWIISVDFS
jgi:hypothetical protein